MAEQIKYVSLDNLTKYDGKIKSHIADADAALKTNLEGQVSLVAENLDKEITRAKAAEATNAAAAQTAQEAADKAQGEVDSLEALVGTLPTGTDATSVIDYVNKKTAGIATDAALGELQGQLNGVQGDVATIKGDYLKASDKTELSNAIAAEKSRAEGIEGGLRTDVDAIKGDYLKAADKTALQGSIDEVAGDVADIVADYLKGADKTELEGKINAKVAQTDYDAKMEEIDGDIDGLQTQINTIMNNPDAEGAINSINEFAQYVTDHGTIADGFRVDIDKNKGDIAAMDTAYKAADTAIKGRLDVLEAIDHDAYVGADSALKSELEGKINLKADASALTEAIQTLEGADTELSGRLDDVEAALGTGTGSVTEKIGTAKQEAIDSAVATASQDATNKANAAESAAKGHADSLNTAMNLRVEALEAIDHTHSNKALLDTYTQTEANLADAVAKKHEHSNLSVLEGITSTKVTTWDAVTSKAAQADLTAEVNRATAKENELQAAIDAFVECTETDINNLFA